MAKKKNITKNSGTFVTQRTFSCGTYSQGKDGTVTVSFDLSKAPIPENVYSASSALFIEGINHETYINFFQYDGKIPRNYLQVRLDDIAVLNLWRNSNEFFIRTTDWYNEAYGKKPSIAVKPKNFENLTSYQVSANLVFSAHQENSAIMSFYFFDPRAAREISLGNTPDPKLMANPVVEVKTNTYIIWDLLNQISEYVGKTIKSIPQLELRSKKE